MCCTDRGQKGKGATGHPCAGCGGSEEMASQNNDQRAEIRLSVERRNVHEFYHFTSALQIPLIARHAAIHPRSVLRVRDVPFIDYPGRWGSPAKAEELIGFVSTALVAPWGMMKDDCHPVLLSLRPHLLWSGRAAFIGIWASDNRIKGLADVESRMSAEDFDSMFGGPRNARPQPPAEVLIRGSVSLSDVQRVYCRNAYSRRILVELLKAEFPKAGPEFEIIDRPGLFNRFNAA